MKFQKKQAGSWSDMPYYLYLDGVETFTQFPALIPASAATGGHLTFWTLSGNSQQTGTPAPDNIIMPTFCGKLVGADWTIPITCGEQTTTVNLGQAQTVRRIRKVVFTGQETWTEVYPGEPEAQAQGIVMYAASLSEIGTDRNDFRCSHFFVGNYRGYLISGQGRINGTSTSAVPEAFTVNYNNGSGGLQNFKAWLASEYAAGHPVTLWYALATEQTSIVNEPLAKIGDYADTVGSTNTGAPQIPLLVGSDNIITFGTELPPSEFQAGFVSWHSVQNVHLRSGGQWS